MKMIGNLKKIRAGSIITVLMLIMAVVSELFIAYDKLSIGVALNLAVLISLLILYFLKISEHVQSLLIAFLLIPLIRILSSSFPLQGMPEYAGNIIISIPLCIAGISAARRIGLTMPEMGLRFDRLHIQLLIGLSGLPLGLLAFSLTEPVLLQKTGIPCGATIWVIVLIFCVGFIEEWIYRGIILNALIKQHGERKAIYYTSLLYAALMISGRSLPYVIFAFLTSVLFCRFFLRFRSILGLSLAHGFINIAFGFLAPYVFGWTQNQGGITISTLLTTSTEVYTRINPTAVIAYDLYGIMLLIGLLIWNEIMRSVFVPVDAELPMKKSSKGNILYVAIVPLFYIFCYVVIYQVLNAALYVQ